DAIDIKCRSPIITSEKFSVMCNITNVYPSIECTLFKITDGKKSVVTHKVQYEESFHPTATLYFETSCELTIPATQLGQGVQQYVVVASASNFPQGHHEYHIERSLLEPPEAVFDPTCISGQGVLKGYILANTTLNCTCWRNVTSHIYSQVLWVKDGILEPSAIRLRNSSTLTLHMTKDIENNFSCLAVSPLGNSSITFNVPKIAFGPTNVMTSVQNLSLNVCSNHSITCWVLQKEVSPDVEFNMKVDHPESFLVRMTTKSLVSTIIITPVRVGNFTLTCNVKNSIFDIEAQANISVNVSESSKNLPAFVVNNGLPISESQKAVKVTCFMQDNSNVVTSLTLQCLNDSKSVNGPVVSMLKSFSRKHNGSKCECQARFKEDCFISRTSSFIIIVAYGPTEMEVSRRNMFMELCTFETLRCSVSSNNVFPGVYFHCNASPADSLVVEQSNNVSTVNSAQFQIASFRKGKFTVTCSAINVLNQKLRVRKDIFITVEGMTHSPHSKNI
ncbi:vascular cell adhesion protein 1, partial [Biomphalaria glabrata]